MLAELIISVLMIFGLPAEEEKAPAQPERVYEETVTISAYCPSGNKTASGTVPRPYKTIATSEKYKLGEELYIEGIGKVKVEDRGGKLISSGERIDLFVGSYEEAIDFGLQDRKVYRLRK